jgi:hypothetical protein
LHRIRSSYPTFPSIIFHITLQSANRRFVFFGCILIESRRHGSAVPLYHHRRRGSESPSLTSLTTGGAGNIPLVQHWRCGSLSPSFTFGGAGPLSPSFTSGGAGPLSPSSHLEARVHCPPLHIWRRGFAVPLSQPRRGFTVPLGGWMARVPSPPSPFQVGQVRVLRSPVPAAT